MAKIRGIKPQFWTDEKMVSLKLTTRLFFIGLWNFCDDRGVFEWKPLELKMKIFPADTFDTMGALRELAVKKCIETFTREGKDYGVVINFNKHQKPDGRYLVFLFPEEEAIPRAHTVTTPCPHVEGEGEGEDKGTENTPGASLERKDITQLLVEIKKRVGIQSFVDDSSARMYGKNLVDSLIKKIGIDEFWKRLEDLLADNFCAKNCNKIKYIYNNVKGFKAAELDWQKESEMLEFASFVNKYIRMKGVDEKQAIEFANKFYS